MLSHHIALFWALVLLNLMYTAGELPNGMLMFGVELHVCNVDIDADGTAVVHPLLLEQDDDEAKVSDVCLYSTTAPALAN